MGQPIDLTNKKFGWLKVICKSYKRTKNGDIMWVCRCKCGNMAIVNSACLRNGETKSCGCYNIYIHKQINKDGHVSRKHGMYKTRIYSIWHTMKQRCYNPNATSYEDYDGRGIKMCKSWYLDFTKFYDWAMENGYDDTLTIDRIDVNRGYAPWNCQWVTNKVQGNNRRTNHLLTLDGETMNITQWSEKLGISRYQVYELEKRLQYENKIKK